MQLTCLVVEFHNSYTDQCSAGFGILFWHLLGSDKLLVIRSPDFFAHYGVDKLSIFKFISRYCWFQFVSHTTLSNVLAHEKQKFSLAKETDWCWCRLWGFPDFIFRLSSIQYPPPQQLTYIKIKILTDLQPSIIFRGNFLQFFFLPSIYYFDRVITSDTFVSPFRVLTPLLSNAFLL